MTIGVLKPIEDFLFSILHFFFVYTGDYGVAIILLTAAVRLVIWPLTSKQFKSIQDMRRIQPKIKELQEKYKNNRQKLNEEIMKFYSKHKINPFSGCLPLILQIPIFFALFEMLLHSKALRGRPFLFFIKDLTLSVGDPRLAHLVSNHSFLVAVPYYLLVILIVVTSYVSQKMMSSDAQQERMNLLMSLFMGFISWRFPAGVLLYWVTTNIWTMLQQYFVIGRIKEVKEVKAIE
jgi:YidC/Oxa1 family membrane protein insertase